MGFFLAIEAFGTLLVLMRSAEIPFGQRAGKQRRLVQTVMFTNFLSTGSTNPYDTYRRCSQDSPSTRSLGNKMALQNVRSLLLPDTYDTFVPFFPQKLHPQGARHCLDLAWTNCKRANIILTKFTYLPSFAPSPRQVQTADAYR